MKFIHNSAVSHDVPCWSESKLDERVTSYYLGGRLVKSRLSGTLARGILAAAVFEEEVARPGVGRFAADVAVAVVDEMATNFQIP
jgi:hypothetical protein